MTLTRKQKIDRLRKEKVLGSDFRARGKDPSTNKANLLQDAEAKRVRDRSRTKVR